jgi:hypothetical protein
VESLSLWLSEVGFRVIGVRGSGSCWCYVQFGACCVPVRSGSVFFCFLVQKPKEEEEEEVAYHTRISHCTLQTKRQPRNPNRKSETEIKQKQQNKNITNTNIKTKRKNKTSPPRSAW